MSTNDFLSLARQIGARLAHAGEHVTVAESCTGGWIAKTLTDVPGSSGWFERGFVTYSNAAKADMLGVDVAMIERQGAVSRAVIVAMARGSLAAAHADHAVAVSGVAGPGGGSADKPVGTVWICWASGNTEPTAECFAFPGDRDAVRSASVRAALSGLLARL